MRCIPAPGTAHGMGTEKTTTHPSLSLRPLYCTLPMPNCHVPPAARRTCRSKRRLLPARGKRGASSPSPRLTRRSLVRPQLGCDGITTRQKPPGHTKALWRHGMESSIPCACSQRRYPSSPLAALLFAAARFAAGSVASKRRATSFRNRLVLGAGAGASASAFGQPACLLPVSMAPVIATPARPTCLTPIEAWTPSIAAASPVTALASQFHDPVGVDTKYIYYDY